MRKICLCLSGRTGTFIKLMLIVVSMGLGGKGLGQIAGDFETKNTTGNWSDFNSWNIRNSTNTLVAAIPGQLPTSNVDVFIQAGHTILVDNASAVCKNIDASAAKTTSISFSSSTSVLTVFGNLLFANGGHNIFSNWTSGAKFVFAGGANQITSNLTKLTTFENLEINKSSGSLTTDGDLKFSTLINVVSGELISGIGKDISGTSPLSDIVIKPLGTITQSGGAGLIRVGASGTNPIGSITVYGILNLNSSTSLSAINISSLSIEDNGITGGIVNVNLTSGAAVIAASSGGINIKNNAALNISSPCNTTWLSAGTPLTLQAGGFLTIANSSFVLPTTYSFLGTVIYNNGTQAIAAATYYTNLTLTSIIAPANKSFTSGLNVNKDLLISGNAILLGSSNVINLGGNWTNYSTAGFTESTSTVVLNGSGFQVINTVGGEDFFKVMKTGSGTLTQTCDLRFGGTSSELNISNGVLDAGTNTLNGTASTALTMSGGILQLAKLTTTLPEFLITDYALTGGTIELNGVGPQFLRGGRIYRGLTFSNSGTKTLTSTPTSVTGVITIANSAVLDVTGNSIGGTNTDLTMTGTSRFITDGASTKPDALGTYSLAPTSTIQFSNNAATQQNIRLQPNLGFVNYGNVDVSGSNVGLSGTGSSLKMQATTTFKVTATGTFNVQNTNGFAGSNTTAINNTSAPTISLVAGSTINYDGINQTITNTVGYQNLKLNGTGLKTAPITDILIEGNFTRAATSTFNANGGKVVFQGSTAQTFTDTTMLAPIEFYNLSNTNTLNVIVNNSFAVQNELNLTPTAKLYLNTGDINMRSTAIRTAYITDLGNTAPSTNITYNFGRFNIERYLFARKAWRLLATPVEASSLSITDSWREGVGGITNKTSTGYGTQITGPSPSSIGMDEPTLRGSMKWYNKATNKYVEILNTADAIARPQGYYLFVRGDRAQNTVGAGGATNLRIRGKILTGNQTFTTLKPSSPNDGFESVGNPYPSQINYKTADKSNLEASFTVWDPTAGIYGVGRFIQYTSTTGLFGDYSNGGITVNTIESGQAFFIQTAVGVSGSITIKESDKLAGSNLVSRNETQDRYGVYVPTLEINLHDSGSNATRTFLDHVVLNFDSNYSNEYDGKDVRKFMNANDNLAIKNGSRNLILERRKNLSTRDTIFLSLTNTKVAPYRFMIDPSVLGNLPLVAYLKDKFLQTETVVSLTDVTNIYFSVTNDAASKTADRFMIVFKTAIAPGQFTGNFISIAVEKNSNKTNTLKWSYSNELNIAQYSIERSNNGTVFTGIGNINAGNLSNIGSYKFTDSLNVFGTNYYRVKAISTIGLVQYSAVVKVVENESKPLFVVQPNPVENKTLHINFEKLQGDFNLRLIAKQGETVFSMQITISSAKEVKNIVLGDAVASGVYELVLVDSTGMKLLQTIFIK